MNIVKQTINVDMADCEIFDAIGDTIPERVSKVIISFLPQDNIVKSMSFDELYRLYNKYPYRIERVVSLIAFTFDPIQKHIFESNWELVDISKHWVMVMTTDINYNIRIHKYYPDSRFVLKLPYESPEGIRLMYPKLK